MKIASSVSKFLKKNFTNFPILVFSVVIIVGIIYFFSFLFPFTNNAFVVANINPVAADVSGFITDIYVKNGQEVKKGTLLFKVYQEPYLLAYKQATANLQEAKVRVEALKKITAKNEDLLKAKQEEYGKVNYEYNLKSAQLVNKSVARLEVETLSYERKALENNVKALKNQLLVDDDEIKQQQHKVEALTAAMQNAKVNLDLTEVHAYADGVINNLYLSTGTPIIQHQPLFSFIDMSNLYIQANFNEIDLRDVRDGDKVIIIPRVFFGSKIYHGVVVGNSWAANRQITTAKNQIQTVTENENNWVMLPQRLPVQIRITDYDNKNYPLSIGSSAYIYIQTR